MRIPIQRSPSRASFLIKPAREMPSRGEDRLERKDPSPWTDQLAQLSVGDARISRGSLDRPGNRVRLERR